MNRTELLARAEQIANYYGQGKQIKSDIDSWLTVCPSHDDSTPSLHISVTDRLLVKCHAGCSQQSVINQLKADGMWVQMKSEGAPKPKNNINIPAHRMPEFDQVMIGREKPTSIYSYVTEDNEPAFWVLRLDRPGKKKVVVPYSSVHYDDGDRFEIALNCTVRPIYRLNEITANPDVEILIVEGEKTVEAAQQIFPEFLVTTWSGGTGGVKKSVWNVLKDRKITLWPDNDLQGIRAMNEIAAMINGVNPENIPQIVFEEPLDDLPEGWDLADDTNLETHSPQLLLSRAVPVNVEKLRQVGAQSVDSSEWIKKYAEKYIKVLEGGSLKFYNLKSMSAEYDGSNPYVWVNSVKTLKEIESIKVFDAFTQKQKYAVDYWLEDMTQPIANGFTYDPSDPNKLIQRGNAMMLNTFPGFAHPAIECNGNSLDPFFFHIHEVMGDKEIEFLLDYIAHMIQFTAQKPGVMIILTGKPGVGKTIICDIIARMLGKQNAVVVDSAAFTQSNFNGLFSGKLFVTINELNVAARRDHTLTGKIKSWITDENYTVNAKFMPQRNERSFHRFVATTNSDIPFPIDTDDRRIALFKVGDRYKDDVGHFSPMFKMLEDHESLSGLMHYFTNHKIKNSVMRPPETLSRELAYHSEDPVVGWLHNVLAAGTLPKDILDQIDKARDWARYGVVIPRSVVVDSVIASTRTNVTKNYVSLRLNDHIMRRNCVKGHENNQVKSEVYDKVAKTYVSIKDRVFEFLPLVKQREIFEMVTGHQVKWPDVDDLETEDNIVPIRLTKSEIPF